MHFQNHIKINSIVNLENIFLRTMALSKTTAVHLFHAHNTLDFYVQNPND